MTGLVRLYKSVELASFSQKYTDFGSPERYRGLLGLLGVIKSAFLYSLQLHFSCSYAGALKTKMSPRGRILPTTFRAQHPLRIPRTSTTEEEVEVGGGCFPPLTPPPPPRLTQKPIFYASRLGGKKSSPAQNLPSLIIRASLARTSSVKQTVASRRGYSFFLTACKKRVH